jgi:hypothetical protein
MLLLHRLSRHAQGALCATAALPHAMTPAVPGTQGSRKGALAARKPTPHTLCSMRPLPPQPTSSLLGQALAALLALLVRHSAPSAHCQLLYHCVDHLESIGCLDPSPVVALLCQIRGAPVRPVYSRQEAAPGSRVTNSDRTTPVRHWLDCQWSAATIHWLDLAHAVIPT